RRCVVLRRRIVVVVLVVGRRGERLVERRVVLDVAQGRGRHRVTGDPQPWPAAGERRADVGIYGGSGFYSFLDDVEEVTVDTPYGRPAAPVAFGEVAGRRVAFLPRHGRDHSLPPHRVPYRANAWAM